MDIGEAFLFKQARPSGPRQETCYLTRWPNSGPRPSTGPALCSLFGVPRRRSASRAPTALRFLLGLQNLAALVHAALQIEVVGTAQFTGILILDIGWLLQSICR